MDLDTGLLRAFVVTAEELHFGRAAGRLQLSQQALSKRIARLEALVATPLFERSRRTVGLTEAGGRLLQPARSALAEVDAALAAVRPDAGYLRIDVLDEHLSILPYVLEGLDRGTDPGVEAVMREHHADLVQPLATGQADVTFGRAGAVRGPIPADLVCRPALLEPICLLVGEQHPLAGQGQVRLPLLADHRLWFPMTGAPPEWRSLLEELAREFSLTIDVAGSTMGFQHFLDRIREGAASFLGGAMRPPPVPGITVVPIVDPVPVFPWSVLWRRHLPRASRDFVASVIDRARAATAEPHPDEAWMPATDRRYFS